MEKRQNEMSQTINEMKSNSKVDMSSNEIKKPNFNKPGDGYLTGISQSKFGSQ
uniref:Uncharacterized protein n=1 Tax=Strongyloides papillosus TaxID=174720 RepID=A0A0N5BZB1_STREA